MASSVEAMLHMFLRWTSFHKTRPFLFKFAIGCSEALKLSLEIIRDSVATSSLARRPTKLSADSRRDRS
jgi:hypothetical protein